MKTNRDREILRVSPAYANLLRQGYGGQEATEVKRGYGGQGMRLPTLKLRRAGIAEWENLIKDEDGKPDEEMKRWGERKTGR